MSAQGGGSSEANLREREEGEEFKIKRSNDVTLLKMCYFILVKMLILADRIEKPNRLG